MSLLHGDHAAVQTEEGGFLATMVGSHEIGSPWTTLIKGWAYGLYSSRTIDVFGDRGRAER